MESPKILRPAIEQRLSLPKYNAVWLAVEAAYKNEFWEDERAYWDYALGLRDSWRNMARGSAGDVKKTVDEIAIQARNLANRIKACSPEIKTLKGYQYVGPHTFMAEDLVSFANGLAEPNSPTEAMRSRPRSMALETAERTYLARALTHFILGGFQISGKPIPGRSALVAMTVNALLDIGAEDEFDAKDVDDLTEDIVKHYKSKSSE